MSSSSSSSSYSQATMDPSSYTPAYVQLINANSSTSTTTAWRMMTESDFDPLLARKWMANNWHRSFYLALVYFVFLIVGKWYMNQREAFRLTKPLIAWNAALTVFSLLGTYYTLPEFVHHLARYGYFDSYCVVGDYYSRQPHQAFWVWAFHFSKAPELGDTVFLILRKKPVSFLHLYHHSTVFVWCWFCYPYASSPPRWGVAMNYAVHSLMYAYYTLRACELRLPRAIAPLITSLQMAQFLACVPLNARALYKTYNGMGGSERGGCDTTLVLALWQQFLYNTYFLLFAKFFYQAYVVRSKKAAVSIREKGE